MIKTKNWKREVAPAFYPIARKEKVWTFKPMPGPHPAFHSLPLATVIRDILNIVKTMKEVKYILNNKNILINGKPRYTVRYPLGLMDILEIQPSNQIYRFLPTTKRDIYPILINKKENSLKPTQIKTKKIIKKGELMFGLHDGSSIISSKSQTHMNVGGSILIDVHSNEIKDYADLQIGNYALITGGTKKGLHGKINNIDKSKPLDKPIITLELTNGNEIKTIYDYIFPIGKNASWIELPTEGNNI